MQPGVNAYASAARKVQTGGSQRDLEADLLIKAASHLQAVADNWATRAGELDAALDFNRKLWTLFAAAVGKAENPLPFADKRNLLNLANFILKQSLQSSATNSAEALPALIEINRNIAAGLRGR